MTDYLKETEEIIEKTLKNANLKIEDIDAVIPVGGSTRIPAVKRLLEDKFPDKVSYKADPDLIVAEGAAIQAAIKNNSFKDVDPIITDVCPGSLGVEILANLNGSWVNGVFDSLIDVNTTIPANKEKIYYTSVNNQKAVDVKVYQGEDSLAANNEKIAEFPVEGIPEAPAGQQEIKVKFTYNLNGMLEVEVTILSTGEKVIKKINHRSMKDDEKETARKRLESEWKDSSMAEDVETIIERAEDIKKDLDAEEEKKINNLLKELKRALIEEDEARVDKYEEELTDRLFELV